MSLRIQDTNKKSMHTVQFNYICNMMNINCKWFTTKFDYRYYKGKFPTEIKPHIIIPVNCIRHVLKMSRGTYGVPSWKLFMSDLKMLLYSNWFLSPRDSERLFNHFLTWVFVASSPTDILNEVDWNGISEIFRFDRKQHE